MKIQSLNVRGTRAMQKAAERKINDNKGLIELKNCRRAAELRDNTINKDAFIRMQPLVLDTVVEDPFYVMGLNFNPVSLVGIVTNKGSKIINANPESLLNKIDVAFPHIGENKVIGKKYKSIYRIDINLHLRMLEDDNEFEVIMNMVSNHEFALFNYFIKTLDPDALEVEDIVTIQSDLQHLFRGWQESSIDVTKDKTKQFLIALDDILGNVEDLTDLDADAYSDNLRSCLAAIEKVLINDARDAKVQYELNIDTSSLDPDKFVETSMGDYRKSIGECLENFMKNDVLEHLRNCDIKRWREIASDKLSELKGNDEDIQCKLRLAYIIDRVYKILNQIDGTLLPSYYAICRDGIYTWARLLGIEKEEVIDIAIFSLLYSVIAKNTDKGVAYSIYDKTLKTNVKTDVAAKIFGDILTARYLPYEDNNLITYDMKPSEFAHIFEDINNGDNFIVCEGMGYRLTEEMEEMEDDELEEVIKNELPVFELKNSEYSGNIMVFDSRIFRIANVYEEIEIHEDVFMGILDTHYIRNSKKWIKAENNSFTLESIKDFGRFDIKYLKNGKTVLVKDGKIILSAFDISTSINGDEVMEHTFTLGDDNSEVWFVNEQNKEIFKNGNILIFDVNAEEYFTEEDLDKIKAILREEEKKELKGEKIK